MALIVTKEQLMEFLAFEKQRKELDTRARNLKKRTDALKAHFKEFLNAEGKESIKRHGFQITLVDGRTEISWKDEFIRVAGPLAADEIAANAPKGKAIQVTPL